MAGQTARQKASRQDLEAALQRADQAARTTRDGTQRANHQRLAANIRQRLREGDFQPGHRILLAVYGDSSLTDTFTVRADRKLLLPNLPPISMVGVLDSELEPFLTKELSKYLRNATVRAQGLLRLAVLGSVANPGFYSFPMDFIVTDAIMEAGGPTGDAAMERAQIRRSGDVAVDRKGMQQAFRLGLTLNDVGARPGDELFVPEDRGVSRWQTVAGVLGVIGGLAWSISALVR